MESPPSSPTSLLVSSPRRTLSLLRERRSSTFPSDPKDKKSPAPVAGFAADHGPKPSEVYGFVGSITTVIATVIYLLWAYTPEPWLRSLGITYYPNKHWALAVPVFVMVTVVLVIAFYIGLNFMMTPPPTSLNTIFAGLENLRKRKGRRNKTCEERARQMNIAGNPSLLFLEKGKNNQ